MNSKRNDNHCVRRVSAMAAMAAVAALMAGCGIVHVHFGSASTGSLRIQPNLAFVHCMRSHGLANFPQPKPSERITVQLKGNSPVVRAYGACKHLLSH